MKLYTAHITATGEELCVAARTSDHAADVFVTFWIARTGDAPGQFRIGNGLPSAYEGNVVDAVVDGDAAGVIVRQTDGSMLFEPTMGR